MVTCDQQEKVASSPKVLLGIFLQIQNPYLVSLVNLSQPDVQASAAAAGVRCGCASKFFQVEQQPRRVGRRRRSRVDRHQRKWSLDGAVDF